MNNHTVLSQCLPVKTKISALRNTHKKSALGNSRNHIFIYVLHNNTHNNKRHSQIDESPLGNFGSPIDCTSRTAELSHLIWFEIVRGLPQVVSEVVKTQGVVFWQKWCCFFSSFTDLCLSIATSCHPLVERYVKIKLSYNFLCTVAMSHYIFCIAITFRYALWLSITNHYLNLYHFRSKGHFGPSSCCTICSGVKLSSSTSAEICERKKMLQKVHQIGPPLLH